MSKTTEQQLEAVRGDELVQTDLTVSPTRIPAGQMEAIKDRVSKLDDMEPGISLQGRYREFEKGQTIRGVFIGYKTIHKTDQKTGNIVPLESANWIESDGNLYMNSGANLIKQLRDTNVGQGTPVQITLVTTEKTKSGNNVNIFDVRILNDLSNIETE